MSHLQEEELAYYVDPPKPEIPITRRSFLQKAIKAGVVGTVLAMDPVPYKRGTAWAESRIPAKYWECDNNSKNNTLLPGTLAYQMITFQMDIRTCRQTGCLLSAYYTKRV